MAQSAREFWLATMRQRMREQREELCDHGVSFEHCKDCIAGVKRCPECGGQLVHGFKCKHSSREQA